MTGITLRFQENVEPTPRFRRYRIEFFPEEYCRMANPRQQTPLIYRRVLWRDSRP